MAKVSEMDGGKCPSQRSHPNPNDNLFLKLFYKKKWAKIVFTLLKSFAAESTTNILEITCEFYAILKLCSPLFLTTT